MSTFDEVWDALAHHHPTADRSFVQRAAALAEEAHAGFVFRPLRQPYIVHPMSVAQRLARWGAPPDVVAAALLHDVLQPDRAHVPEPAQVLARITQQLGRSVAERVESVHRLHRFGPRLRNIESTRAGEAQLDRERLSLFAVEVRRDPEAVILKLADRIDVLTALEPTDADAMSYAQLTVPVFTPFARRLGMTEVADIIEANAVRLRDPRSYGAAVEKVQGAGGHPIVTTLLQRIGRSLTWGRLEASVEWRGTAVHAVAAQLRERRRKMFLTWDRCGVVVITTADAETAYRALGIVHSLERSEGNVVDRLWQATLTEPRALVTHIRPVGDGGRVAVHIAPRDHDVANRLGLAAAWLGVTAELLPDLPPLEPPEQGHIQVLTPTGDVYQLPIDATAIDFAFAVHTEIGRTMIGVEVNGHSQDPRKPLKPWDVVRILTTASSIGPNPKWAKAARTPAARAAIARWSRARTAVELCADGHNRVGLFEDVAGVCAARGISVAYFHGQVLANDRVHLRLGVLSIDERDVEGLRRAVQDVAHVSRVTVVSLHGLDARLATAVPTSIPLTAYAGADFVGREREIANVIRQLQTGSDRTAVMVYGQRRIGKTMLIRRLEQHYLQSDAQVGVFIDASGIGRGQSVGLILYEVCRTLAEKLTNERLAVPRLAHFEDKPGQKFQGFMHRFREAAAATTVIVLIDECEAIGDLSEDDLSRAEAFALLRAQVQHGVGVHFVFTGCGTVEAIQHRSGLSELLNVARPVYVDHMLAADAEALARQRCNPAPIHDDALATLLSLTAHHPLYTSLVCDELRPQQSDAAIAASDVHEAVAHLSRTGAHMEAVFEHYWLVGSRTADAEARRAILACVAEAQDAPLDDEAIMRRVSRTIGGDRATAERLHELRTYRALAGDPEGNRLRLPLLGQWLRSCYPFEHALRLAASRPTASERIET